MRHILLATRRADDSEMCHEPIWKNHPNQLQSFGNRESGRDRQQNMCMVRHATNLKSLHLILASNSAQKKARDVRANLV